jgi:hypothetical protein
MPATDLTEEEKKQLEQNAYMQRVQAISNPGAAISNFFANRPSSEELFNRASKARSGEVKMFTNEQTPKGKLVEAGLVDRNTPIQDVQKIADARANKVYPADTEDARIGAGMTALLNAQKSKAAAAPVDTDQRSNDRRASLAGTDTNAAVEKRANPFGQLSADVPDYAKVKSQGQGEALMYLSKAMFGNPNLSMAMSQGLGDLAKVSGATRKELSEIKKDYNAQQLSLAKANELFEQGQEDKAFKYLKQSQDNAYHMQTGMAALISARKPSGSMDLFNAVQKQNPNMSALDIISAMSGAKNDPKSDQSLRDAYLKSPYLQTMYPSIDDYIKKMSPAGAQVAGVGNTGYSRGVFDINGRQIQ